MVPAAEYEQLVRRAIERLYEVFARYGPPSELHASPLRDPVAILRVLLSAPLRELTAEQVLPYAGWAITTVGGSDDYRHFLPRICELAMNDGSGTSHIGAEPAVITHRVTYDEDDVWPAEEVLAVREAFLAAWARALDRDLEAEDALRWLAGLAVLGSVADALAIWRQSPSPHAVGHLGSLVGQQGDQFWLAHEIDGDGFWDCAANGVYQEVLAWLRSPDVLQWLDAAPPPSNHYTQWICDKARDFVRSSPRPGSPG